METLLLMSRVVALELEFLEELAHFPGILAAGPSVGTTRTGKISRLGAKERGNTLSTHIARRDASVSQMPNQIDR
jgi:hypothetical protein